MQMNIRLLVTTIVIVLNSVIIAKAEYSVEYLNKKFIEFQNTNADSALYYAEEMYGLSILNNNDSLRYSAGFHVGDILSSKEKYDEAMNILLPLQMELKAYNYNHSFRLKTLSLVARNYRDLGEFEKALEEFFIITNELEENPSTKDNEYELAKLYTDIAICYGKSGRDSTTIKYVEKSIAIYEKYNDIDKLVVQYNNLGYTYFRLNQYSLAEKTLLIGYSIDSENGILNESLAELYMKTKKYDKALIHASKAYNWAFSTKKDGRIEFNRNLIKEIVFPEGSNSLDFKAEGTAQSDIASERKSNTETDFNVILLISLLITNVVTLAILFRKKR